MTFHGLRATRVTEPALRSARTRCRSRIRSECRRGNDRALLPLRRQVLLNGKAAVVALAERRKNSGLQNIVKQ